MHMNPPFRADHVGSLLRPASLRKAFRAHADGQLSDAEFATAQDAAILEAVHLQESLGLQSITDGEFRRASYWSHFIDGIDGFEVATARFAFHDETGASYPFLAPHVVGKVRRAAPLSGGEFDFLKGVTKRTPKITLPSPPTFEFWDQRGAAAAAGYDDVDVFCEDIARVFREELTDLAARGARYIQLDDVPLAMLCDEGLRARMTAVGEDPDQAAARMIRLFNDCLADRPAGMTVALHVCRGNFKGHWLSEGGYDWIARRMLREIDVDTYFLEFDTPRAGGFACLADLPANKSVVLGLVSSKVPALETWDSLARRVDEAVRYVPLDCLALSPQCGFASAVSGNPVTQEDQAAKLRLIVETAEKIWG